MENKGELLKLIYIHVPKDVLESYGFPTERTPILITEDGVRKYQGDSWFYINNHGVVVETSASHSTGNPNFITKRYHSKDEAIRYATLLHEAKTFSLSDLNEVIADGRSNKDIRERLRKIAYEKI